MIKVRDSYLTEHKWLECHGIQGIELKDFDAHLDALFMHDIFLALHKRTSEAQ